MTSAFNYSAIILSLGAIFLFFIFCLFWFLILTKKFLFWLWLWQVKNYHCLRFVDHFRTCNGKKIILNWLNLIKIILIAGFALAFFYNSLFYLWVFYFIAFFVSFAEIVSAIKHIRNKSFKKPIRTKKTFIISTIGILLLGGLTLLFQNNYDFKIVNFMILVDFFSPIIFSIFILLFQMPTIFLRNRIIAKAKKKRGQFKDLIVIGITGSYGKSSTKEFLYQILSQKFNGSAGSPQVILKTAENINSEIGIAQTILNDLKPEHKIFICEMGAYRQGGIKLLADIIQPKIGILTGINEQHLATFGSQEKIINAKFELIKALPRRGIAVLNTDNRLVKENDLRFTIQDLRKIKCSLEEIDSLKINKDSLAFKIQDVDFKAALAGRQNVINLLLAIRCGQELGMNLSEISQAVAKIKPLPKTMELKQGKEGVQIIDDTYSANPQGVISALEHLKLWQAKKIIVMPCLIELGKTSEKIHQKIGESIGQICDLAVITTKDKFSEIEKSAVNAGMSPKNIVFLQNPDRIFEKLKPYLESENVILLESRVPEKLISLLLFNK